VRSGYQMLISHESSPLDALENLIWHTKVPLKIFVLAWGLLCDRLPTKINLLNRGIISAEDISYSARCGQVENADVSSLRYFWIPLAAGSVLDWCFEC